MGGLDDSRAHNASSFGYNPLNDYPSFDFLLFERVRVHGYCLKEGVRFSVEVLDVEDRDVNFWVYKANCVYCN